jgi:hypothetical protein
MRHIALGGNGSTGPRARVLLITCLFLLAVPAAADAAPPANDNRADADMIARIPAKVDGTTAEATREDTDPASFCGQDDASVWYRVDPQRKGRVVVSVSADGDLDALVDVYRVQRSQLSQVTCQGTDAKGEALLAFRTGAKDSYLIRVSQRVGSVSGTFHLSLQFAQPEATPPGPPLPRAGVKGTLDRVLNPSAAYSITMNEGVTYRFHLASGTACTPLLIYPPGTTSFDSGTPVRRLGCGGYTLFTPRGGQGGLYTILAKAPRQRGTVKYRLTGGRATVDDTTPGRFIHNYERVRGRLSGGGIDVVDLYRFDVRRRSALRVGLISRAGFELDLLRDSGHVLRTSSGEIRTRIPRGRYYLAVRAAPRVVGSYTLSRLSRTLTDTHLSTNGKKSATVTPGKSVRLGVAVKPAADGPARVVVERFDPLEGWQFSRRYTVQTSGRGTVAIEWQPPSVGRYRVQASFRGTRGFSPSHSGYARVHVEAPLRG